MRVAIRHELAVPVGSGVGRAALHLLLTPRSTPTQRVHEWTVAGDGVEGAASFRDGFGNQAMLVTRSRPGPEIAITVTGLVETMDRAGVVGRVEGEPVPVVFTRRTARAEAVPAIMERFGDAPSRGGARIGLFHEIMQSVAAAFNQESGDDTQRQSGGAQMQTPSAGMPKLDAPGLADAFVGVVRGLGLPARYVGGYLLGSAMPHAWAEAWDDDLGWIGFDPALRLSPTDRHVRVAVGLDSETTAPVRSVPDTGGPRVVGLAVTRA